MSQEADIAGKLVFHKKAGIKVYDKEGKQTKPEKGPPPGKKMKKVGEMTINFYQGSCWVEICQGGQCHWYFWPGEGCPF